MKIEINLPCVISFDDYHEIATFRDNLKHLIPGVKAKEVGANYYYYGLFYLDKLPPKEVIISLLKKAGWEPENKDYAP